MLNSAMVQSGSFKVAEDNISSYLECATSGIVSFPWNKAYGTWEFSVYKGADPNTTKIYFINDLPILTNHSGMGLVFTSTERIAAEKSLVGVLTNPFYSAAAYVNINTWYTCKVTRTLGNVYHYYLNNTLVVPEVFTNPFTDVTALTSKFCVIDLDAGDRFRSNTKFLGVSQ